MKKILLLFFLIIATMKIQAQSLTTLTAFNPFDTIYGWGVSVLNDTSGKIWYITKTYTGDTVYVTNQDHNFLYTFYGVTPYEEIPTMNSRNQILWESNNVITMIQDSSIEQFTLPSMDSMVVNTSYLSYDIWNIADDHNGNDYFISRIANYNTHTTDSVFITKFDGVNFTTYNLTTLGVYPPPYTSFIAPRVECDYAGNVYFISDTGRTISKFDGVNWTTHSYPDYLGWTIWFDYSNNIYGLGNTINKVLPNDSIQSIYSSDHCNVMFLGNDSSVWLDSGGKLLKWDGNEFVMQDDLENYAVGNSCDVSCTYGKFNQQGDILLYYAQQCWDKVLLYSVDSVCTAFFTLYPDTTEAHTWIANNLSSSNNPLSYMWFWGDGDSTAGVAPSHTYSSAGYFNICLRVSDGLGCEDLYCDSSNYIFKTEEVITVNVVDKTQTPTGISDTKNNHSISLYPNPSNGKFTLTSDISQGGMIEVYNITGAKVFSQNTSSLTRANIDISQQAKGIYLVKVSNTENVWTQRVVVE